MFDQRYIGYALLRIIACLCTMEKKFRNAKKNFIKVLCNLKNLKVKGKSMNVKINFQHNTFKILNKNNCKNVDYFSFFYSPTVSNTYQKKLFALP